MTSKNEIVLIGGGGHCYSVIDVIESENKFKIAGIVDKPELLGESVLSYKIIARDEDLKNLISEYKNFIITVGQIESNNTRVRLFNSVKNLGGTFPAIVSLLAYVSKHALIDEGTIIMHKAFVNAKARIGKNTIINTSAIIEHNAVVGNHCHVSTGAIVNGECRIEDHSFIGSNAVLVHGTCIGENALVAAGAVVIGNVEPGSVYAGNPAKRKRYKNEK